MKTLRTRLCLAVLSALALPALLAGCTNDEPRRITFATWKQSDPVPQPQAGYAPIHHSVAFAPGGQLSDTEREALAIFLRRNAIPAGSRVTLSAPLPADGNAELLGQRLSALRAELASLGVSAATLPPGTGAGAALQPDRVLVTAQVLSVVQPACPGYNTPIQLDLEHRPIITPGCSNAINLGLMVANPADLRNGQALAPADGTAAALAIQRYRTGEVWPTSEPANQVPFRESTR